MRAFDPHSNPEAFFLGEKNLGTCTQMLQLVKVPYYSTGNLAKFSTGKLGKDREFKTSCAYGAKHSDCMKLEII